MMTKSYSEMMAFDLFKDRLEYLKLEGEIGHSTFGFDRYINQRFYRSSEWRHVRNLVINRDRGCDLGILGHEIHRGILIHHISPMSVQNIVEHDAWILDPEYLITTTQNTHNAIHYGTELPVPVVVSRSPDDTRLWAKRN